MLRFHKRSWSRCGIWDSNSFDQEEPELELESLFDESAQAYLVGTRNWIEDKMARFSILNLSGS